MKYGLRCRAPATLGLTDIGTGTGADMCGSPEYGADRPIAALIGLTATTTTMTGDGPTMKVIGIMKITAITMTGVTSIAKVPTTFNRARPAPSAGPLFSLAFT